jgi:nickel/cobalt transporter (NicO) family protein
VTRRGRTAARRGGARARRPRALLALAALAAALLALPATAGAHPLGNFSLNRLDVVRVSSDRVDVAWTLDKAEIPTFQERGRSPQQVLAEARELARRAIVLEADRRRVPLELAPGGRIAFPRGQGGLHTTRIELALHARVTSPRRVILRDRSFAGRVGWRAIVVRPGRDTAVRSSVPATDPTRGLRAYPQALLSSPPDQELATLAVRPGGGTVVAPRASGEGLETTSSHGGDGGFAALLDDAAAGRGVLVLLLLAAAGWGALHALSPGHGKSMVAAYLVGTRGSPRDAVLLGLTVTVTHTAGVFALGLVTLALSAYVLPEDLYPWLTLVSGLMVVSVGAAVLRRHLRRGGAARVHDHGHDHTHGHAHAHPHHHDEPPSRRSLLALGASAGLIPCPSALVVLLAAIAQHELVLGLTLIVAFSAGLATTLTGLGLVVVATRRMTFRLPARPKLAAALALAPAVSATVIIGAGCLLAGRALPMVL